MAFEIVQYHCDICGYHVYRILWKPKEGEVLSYFHEISNNYDIFTTKNLFD